MKIQIAALAALLGSCASDAEFDLDPPADTRDSEPEVEGKTEPFRYAAAGDNDHADITTDVLSFLWDSVAEDLGDQNEAVDEGDLKEQSENHTDDCKIGGGFDIVRARHRAAVRAFNPDALDLDRAEREFGRLLHTVQDFYAHSNWVEIHDNDLAGDRNDIIGRGTFDFPSVGPGSEFGGVAVISEPLPPSWQVTREAGSRVPWVTRDGESVPGLMTGTYRDNVGTDICPDNVQIPHGPWVFAVTDDYDTYLAKDAPASFYHDLAISRARVQTKEEFCRLARNVVLAYGERGAAALVYYWYPSAVLPNIYPPTVQTLENTCPTTRGKVTALLTTVL